MNYRDGLARDPRTSSEDDVAPALASFATESSIVRTPSQSEDARDALWEFPEEGLPSAAVANDAVIRKPSIYPSYASLAATIFVAAITGAWWGGLIPRSHPVETDAAAQAILIAPVVTPPADPPSHLPVQLIPSVEVRPSTSPPVASVVANPPPIPVALSEVDKPRQPTSMARGTSGDAPAAPTPMLGPGARTETIPTAPMVAANPAVRSPALEPPPALEASAASPPPSRILTPAARPEPEAVLSVATRTEQSEIQRTLGQYRSAYQLLDAEAARAVWPSVDVRALARAFDTLSSQQLAFETCLFDIAEEAATAQCRGSATYTPKVGNRGPRLEPRQWTFHLRKVDEAWKIQSAQTRR